MLANIEGAQPIESHHQLVLDTDNQFDEKPITMNDSLNFQDLKLEDLQNLAYT